MQVGPHTVSYRFRTCCGRRAITRTTSTNDKPISSAFEALRPGDVIWVKLAFHSRTAKFSEFVTPLSPLGKENGRLATQRGLAEPVAPGGEVANSGAGRGTPVLTIAGGTSQYAQGAKPDWPDAAATAGGSGEWPRPARPRQRQARPRWPSGSEPGADSWTPPQFPRPTAAPNRIAESRPTLGGPRYPWHRRHIPGPEEELSRVAPAPALPWQRQEVGETVGCPSRSSAPVPPPTAKSCSSSHRGRRAIFSSI